MGRQRLWNRVRWLLIRDRLKNGWGQRVSCLLHSTLKQMLRGSVLIRGAANMAHHQMRSICVSLVMLLLLSPTFSQTKTGSQPDFEPLNEAPRISIYQV